MSRTRFPSRVLTRAAYPLFAFATILLVGCQDPAAPTSDGLAQNAPAAGGESGAAPYGLEAPEVQAAPTPLMGDSVAAESSTALRPMFAVTVASSGYVGFVKIPTGAAGCYSRTSSNARTLLVTGMQATSATYLPTEQFVQAQVFLLRWNGSSWQIVAQKAVNKYVGLTSWFHVMDGVSFNPTYPGYYKVQVLFSWWTYGVANGKKTVDFNSMYDYQAVSPSVRGAGWCYMY